MNSIKCFDVVEMVTSEATSQFGSLLCVDEDKVSALKDYCKAIDILAEHFGGISYEVEVNDETTDITISMVCDEFETDKNSSGFYELIGKAKNINFKAYDEEHIQIDFIFGGIWSRAM